MKKEKLFQIELLNKLKNLGHKDLSKDLPNDIAAEIALEHSKQLFQEIVLAEKYTNEI